jgi:hypothetical protein
MRWVAVLLPNLHFVLKDKVGSQGPLFYCLEFVHERS